MRMLRAATLASVIPWLPVIAPAAPLPPVASPCTAAGLHAELSLQGATGSLAGGVVLTNRGASPCSLLGRIEVRFLGGSDPAGVVRSALAPDRPDPGVPLPSLRAPRPGQSAFAGLWWSNWCGHPAPTRLALRLPYGEELDLPISDGGPRCDAPGSPSSLGVRQLEPRPTQPKPSTRLPLAAAIVEHEHIGPKVIPLVRGRRGGTAVFHVALTNTSRRPFRFGSCPVYVEGTGLDEPPELYVLRCRPAGTIQPDASVVFEMRIRIPRGARLGQHPLTWELGPATYLPPFAGGVLAVTG